MTLAQPIILGALVFIGCSEAEDVVTVSPEIATELARIQNERHLTDGEISAALERWISMYTIAGDMLESDDVLGSGTWTPERFAQLMADSEEALNAIRQEDRMLALYSLGHLSALNEERYEEVANSLRRIVVAHCTSGESHPDDTGRKFREKVHALAKTDVELKRLLSEANTDEKSRAGSR